MYCRNYRAVRAVQIMNAPCWASYLQRMGGLGGGSRNAQLAARHRGHVHFSPIICNPGRRDHVLQQCLTVKAGSPAISRARSRWLGLTFHMSSISNHSHKKTMQTWFAKMNVEVMGSGPDHRHTVTNPLVQGAK